MPGISVSKIPIPFRGAGGISWQTYWTPQEYGGITYNVHCDDGTCIREGIRGDYFVQDITLTETGFDGDENTDWENVESTKIYATLPTGLTSSVIYSGVKLDWTSDAADEVEVWHSTDNITFTLLATTATGVETYTHIIGDSEVHYYKIRGKLGLAYSEYTSVEISGEADNWLEFSAVTTGAETLSLQRMDVKSGGEITIDWGDTNDDTYTNTGAARTHDYAGAGTWTIKVYKPHNLIKIELTDAKIVFNSSGLITCSSDLVYFKLFKTSGAAGTIINSSDFTSLNLTDSLILDLRVAGTYSIDTSDFADMDIGVALYLVLTKAGTYVINSEDLSGFTLNREFRLQVQTPGTYNIDSSHFTDYVLTYSLYLLFDQAGTYVINTAHFAGTSQLITGDYRLIFPPANTTKTVARADFAFIRRLANVQLQMGLTSAQVDAVLLGLYDVFALKANTGGTVSVATSNEAPTGIYQAKVPPTTGLEARYELLNDSGGVSSVHWATVSVTA